MAGDISFKVSADLAEIRAQLQGLRGDFQAAGQNARASFGDAGVAKMRGELAQLRTEFRRTADEGRKGFKDLGIDGISSQLRGLRNLVGGFAGSIAGALGVREVINLADSYTSMTARLRLATKATGDFEQVQALLAKTATETRAPLQDTVNLYSQVAPSLQRILNSQEIVGVIATVNQAIALSGSSAEASSAALVQFTQGLASGTLRGEELNSILEQTPALADAIAEGLGVTRGELRALGEAGELTAERVVTALQKVSGRVASDFQSVPVTVGQAFVLLNNSILQFVGTLDQSTGTTSALANAIISVGAGIDALSGSKETLKSFTDVLINGFDLAFRVVRVFGTAIAVTAAVIERLIGGDLKGALATYAQGWKDVADTLTDELASTRADTQKPQRDADARLAIETKLVDEQKKLERLRAVAAGEASADILKGEKELATERNKVAEQAMKDRLKAEESTADKLRELYAKSLTDAQKARDEAGKIRTDAGNEATDLRDRAAARRGRGLSESEREDQNRRAASGLTARATLAAGAAQSAARDGDLKKAEKLAADAAKLAERAQRAADALQDDDDAARALEELARVQEKIGEAQAQTKEAEAKQLEANAVAIEQQIKLAEERIAAVKAELSKPITLQADIAEAEKSIKTLEERLANLPDKTVTVTVQTVNAPGTPAEAAESIPALATGGKLTGPGSDRSDNLLLWGSPGEWMINARASRYYGDAFMHRLNSMQLPRFADGGPLTPGVRAAANESAGSVAATFNFPGMSPIAARVDRRTASTLTRELRREARKAGR